MCHQYFSVLTQMALQNEKTETSEEEKYIKEPTNYYFGVETQIFWHFKGAFMRRCVRNNYNWIIIDFQQHSHLLYHLCSKFKKMYNWRAAK